MARTLTIDPHEPEAGVIGEAVRVLREGGVVAYPTETFYGLGVDARSQTACRRVFDMKGRPAEQAFPCIVSGLPQLHEAASRLEPAALTLALKFWPGPLTLIVQAKPGLAASAPDGGIAIRASSVRLARDLAQGIGAPITATSANRSGEPAATTAAEVDSALGAGPDLILDGGASPGGLPSTIVDVRRIPLRLVRQGRIAFVEVIRAVEMP